jgi:amino acid transporter
MHLRGVETSSSDTWHIILTAVGVMLCMFPAIIFSARAFGKGFLIFSIASIIVFLVFGALAGMDGAKIAENLPTPYTGVWERINIFIYFIWVNVLAINLLRQNNFNGLNRK